MPTHKSFIYHGSPIGMVKRLVNQAIIFLAVLGVLSTPSWARPAEEREAVAHNYFVPVCLNSLSQSAASEACDSISTDENGKTRLGFGETGADGWIYPRECWVATKVVEFLACPEPGLVVVCECNPIDLERVEIPF